MPNLWDVPKSNRKFIPQSRSLSWPLIHSFDKTNFDILVFICGNEMTGVVFEPPSSECVPQPINKQRNFIKPLKPCQFHELNTTRQMQRRTNLGSLTTTQGPTKGGQRSNVLLSTSVRVFQIKMLSSWGFRPISSTVYYH